jgi:hypothetical protein
MIGSITIDAVDRDNQNRSAIEEGFARSIFRVDEFSLPVGACNCSDAVRL